MQELYLEIQEKEGVRRIVLGDEALTIGRAGENRVVLNDNLASRFHAVINKTPEGLWLRDLASSNGTALNGQIVRRARLAPGDVITVGKTRMKVLPDGQERPNAKEQPAAVEDLPPAPPSIDDLPDEPGPPPPTTDSEEAEVLTEEDVAEPLTDEDVASDEEAGPITMETDGIELGPLRKDTRQREVVRDSDSLLVAMAESLPDKSFGESDIALVSARGQLVHAAGSPPPKPQKREAVEWFRLILLICSRSHATDVHIEPKGECYVMRIRVDGTMIELGRISNALGVRLSAVVKVLSEIDIAQRNTIQEGHFSSRVPARTGKSRRIDYRVSFAPSVFGQKLVLRVLDTTYAPLHLRTLQMPESTRQELERMIRQDAGMVLVCGPTGSGKTTTLYALIRSTDLAHRNVVTIEDPVEIQLEGVTQVPVDESQDKTFSSLLRSMLRQDPDVILIGEIRDAETARIAMQAAITGHMVFSTVHTQNTTGTIFRLLDLGVEPYLISQALQVVLAQRLVRQLCPACKKPVPATPVQLQRMGPAGQGVSQLFVPRGCPRCLNTGFSGRRAIFEMLSANDRMRELILHTPTARQIEESLEPGTFQRLHQSGYQLVAEGVVAFDEVERAIGREAR